ncbi:hypothetical protein MKY51_09355 [Solibacillus sp. FSL R5-0691]|uniref:hypothetical protein n=1 Tax=Solibacillus sp. FSL R5-0691 TaxID=2921653 RepID=UPI0030D26A80
MMLLDLLFDIVFNIYTSLGFGSKEYKIESKMEKIKCDHPQAYEIYVQNQVLFETDAELSRKILDLNVKSKLAVNNTVKEIYARFAVTV